MRRLLFSGKPLDLSDFPLPCNFLSSIILSTVPLLASFTLPAAPFPCSRSIYSSFLTSPTSQRAEQKRGSASCRVLVERQRAHPTAAEFLSVGPVGVIRDRCRQGSAA